MIKVSNKIIFKLEFLELVYRHFLRFLERNVFTEEDNDRHSTTLPRIMKPKPDTAVVTGFLWSDGQDESWTDRSVDTLGQICRAVRQRIWWSPRRRLPICFLMFSFEETTTYNFTINFYPNRLKMHQHNIRRRLHP